jgi:hypothetical protein
MQQAASALAGAETSQLVDVTEQFTAASIEANAIIDDKIRIYNEYLDVSKQLNDSSALSEKAQKKLLESMKKLDDEMEEVNKKEKEWLDQNKELMPALKEQKTEIDFINRHWKKGHDIVGKNVEANNSARAAFLGVTQSLLKLSPAASEAWSIISKLGLAYGPLIAALAFLAKGIADVVQMQDKFRTMTFQLIGGQEEMIRSTNALRMELGVTTDEAIATMAALSEAGFGAQDAIRDLAKANTEFSIATNISQKDTAKYQRAIFVLTGSAEEAKRALSEMSAMIKQSGMSAAEAAGFMNTLADATGTMLLEFDANQVRDWEAAIKPWAAGISRAGGNAGAFAADMARMTTEQYDNAAAWAFLNVQLDELDTPGKKAEAIFARMGPALDDLRERYGSLSVEVMKSVGIPMESAKSFRLLGLRAEEAGKSIEQFINDEQKAADVAADFQLSMQTLTRQIQKILGPIMAMSASLAETLVPALTSILEPISWLITKFGELMAWIQKYPIVAKPLNILLGVVLVTAALKAVGALKLLRGTFTSLKDAVTGIISGIKGTINWFRGLRESGSKLAGTMGKVADTTKKASDAAMQSAKVGPGAGASIKGFFQGLASGLKAMGTPAVLKGVLVLGLLMVISGAVILALAAAMKELGLSMADMAVAAGAMLAVSVAFLVFAIGINIMGAAALSAAPGLAVLALVILAIGVAALLAGVGVKLIVDAFTAFFEVVLENAAAFIAVITTMALMMPLLAAGVMLLGGAMLLAGPAILLGFGALMVAAVMGLFIAPVLGKVGTALTKIATAAAVIPAGAGAALLGLAGGIVAFMGALMGIAAAGAIGGLASIFGVKSPIEQAEEIAQAIKEVAEPATKLAGALTNMGRIGDVFGPFIDGILGRKDELMESAAILEELAERVEHARERIDIGPGFPFAPITLKAEPTRKPLITEDTARKIREERNQALLVRGTEEMRDEMKKVGTKVGELDVGDLIALLREWLPKIAKGQQDSGQLSSLANQWL